MCIHMSIRIFISKKMFYEYCYVWRGEWQISLVSVILSIYFQIIGPRSYTVSQNGVDTHMSTQLRKNYSKPPRFDVLQRTQASTRTPLHAILKFKMMTKLCFYEAKENVPPAMKQ